MAIQIPNPGTGNGQTGDNEFVLWSKVKSNFENTTHAASRLVGTNNGNVVEMTANGLGGTGWGVTTSPILTPAEFLNPKSARGSGVYSTDSSPAIPPDMQYATVLQLTRSDVRYKEQIVIKNELGTPILTLRSTKYSADTTYDAQVRIYTSLDPVVYNTTTASGANVVVTATGELRRSTSSERYKDILADLELDDAAYANAMQLAPIVYRSTAEADNPDYHYYSFSAEKLGAFDPAFTLWRDTETVTDDKGNVTEQPLAERVAEGININALLAMSHAIAIKQGKMLADLEQRLSLLEPKPEV